MDDVRGQPYDLYSVVNDKATKLSVSTEMDLIVIFYNGASEYAFVVKDNAAGFDWNTVNSVVVIILALNAVFVLHYALIL